MSSENVLPAEAGQAGKTPEAPDTEDRTPPAESQAKSPAAPFNWQSIAETLSQERLSKYLTRSSGDVERGLALYIWNQEIGAALTVTLSEVEVCLRNQVARALANAYGPAWPSVARLRHNHVEVRRELEKAESRLTKGVPSTPDIIAASDFNLWRELCKSTYAGVFWAKRVPIAFPHVTFPGKEREILAAIHRRVDLLLKLRNRIAHHEPIIGSHWEKIGAKLADRHHDAIELLQWMSPDLASWVISRDRFDAVMAVCPIV